MFPRVVNISCKCGLKAPLVFVGTGSDEVRYNATYNPTTRTISSCPSDKIPSDSIVIQTSFHIQPPVAKVECPACGEMQMEISSFGKWC